MASTRAVLEDFEVMSIVLTALCLGGYSLYLMLGFKNTGPFVIMLGEIVSKDALSFSFLFLVVLVTFSTCFWLLESAQNYPEKRTFVDSLARSLSAFLGDVNREDYNVGLSGIIFASLPPSPFQITHTRRWRRCAHTKFDPRCCFFGLERGDSVGPMERSRRRCHWAAPRL